MGGGSISAMNSSLKSNNKLIRRNRLFTKFSMNRDLDYTNTKTISREENLLIIKENKRRIEKNTRIKRFIGVFFILAFVSLIVYGLGIYS